MLESSIIEVGTEGNSTEVAMPERAKFGDRFFAAIVDNIIIRIPMSIAFFFLIPLSWTNPFFGLFFAISVELVVILLYFAVFAHCRNGQTLGKKWNKIKVVDLEGTDLTLGHFIIREFVARGVLIIASMFVGVYANLWRLLTCLRCQVKVRPCMTLLREPK